MSNDMTAAAVAVRPLDEFVERNAQLNDQATLDGLAALLDKVAPLLQGRRLHNIVDLLSAISDTIDLADDAMLQKLMKGYEEAVAGAWNIGNAMRYSMHQAAQEAHPPSLWQCLMRLNRDEDARRGLSMAVNLFTLLGRQARIAAQPMPED